MTFEQLMLIIAIIIVVFLIITFIMSIVNSSRLSTIMDYAEDGNLPEALSEAFDKLEAVTAEYESRSQDELSRSIELLAEESRHSVRKMAAVHFNAFDDVSGEQSFALALLDASNSGFIITSLYGHNSCNTYLRTITGGRCEKHLLDEEQRALANAIAERASEEVVQ